MLLALRINVLAKGYSGISLETLRKYVAAFNGKYHQICHLLLSIVQCKERRIEQNSIERSGVEMRRGKASLAALISFSYLNGTYSK